MAEPAKGAKSDAMRIDPTLVRVAFFVLALASGGVAIPFYLLAAFIIPDDRDGPAARRVRVAPGRGGVPTTPASCR